MIRRNALLICLAAAGLSATAAYAQTAPSSSFTLGQPVRDGSGSARLPATFPGPGSVAVSDARRSIPKRTQLNPPPVCDGTTRCGSFAPAAKPKIKRIVTSISAAGTVELKLIPTAATKRKQFDGQSVKVRVKVVFTPAGGTPSTVFKPVRLVRAAPGCGISRAAAHAACSPVPE